MGMVDSERKFEGLASAVPFALACLRQFCLPDGDHPEGCIASIYYDTPRFALYEEKSAGDFIKVKCRLRWYAPDLSPDSDKTLAFMEVKRRVGESRRKGRQAVSLPRAWIENAPLDDPYFGWLLTQHALPLQEWLPPGLAATVVIRYHRHRFVCPYTQTRVSLDTQIEGIRPNPRRLPAAGATRLPVAVVELKGGTADVPWLRHLRSGGFSRRSFSKYGACMSRLLGEE
jgi:SPX domain protein involved in polyphosphate accumulation